MKYQRFGKIDFNVSTVGFGGASIAGEGRGYGFGSISEDKAIRLVKAAYERGINLYDTAPIYGFGTSEVRLGKALKNIRDKVFIVSKSGVGWHDNLRVDMDNDPKKTQKMLEDSLRRLNCDYIDLYMIHWPDKKWDIRYPLEVLSKAKDSTKIKYIGLCNTNSDDLARAKEICTIDAIQIEHNLLAPEKLQLLKSDIEQSGHGVMAWGSLDKGILAGTVKHGRKYDKDDARDKAPWWNKKEITKKIDLVTKIEKKFDPYKIFDLAMSYNFAQNLIHTHLCGAKSEKQLDQLLRVLNSKVPEQILLEVQDFINDRV